jgi:Retinal pigment epithelial membrane protein
MCHSIANAYDDTASGSVIVDMVRMEPLSFSKAAAAAGAMPGSGSNPNAAFEYASAVPARKLVRYTVSTTSSSSSSSSSSSGNYKQQQLGSGRHCDYAGVAACVSGAAHRYVYCGVGADESGRYVLETNFNKLSNITSSDQAAALQCLLQKFCHAAAVMTCRD